MKKPYENWQLSSKEDQWKQEQRAANPCYNYRCRKNNLAQSPNARKGRIFLRALGWVVATLPPAANPKTQCFSKEEGFKMGTSFRSPVWKPEINFFFGC